jgi:hypothetical protein
LVYGTAETFFPAEELVLSEMAHRGVGVAERVQLAEQVREAGRVRLTHLLKSVLVESCGRERRARLLDGRVGRHRPHGLREPADEFDPVELQLPRGLISIREALSDEDGGTGTENAAELAALRTAAPRTCTSPIAPAGSGVSQAITDTGYFAFNGGGANYDGNGPVMALAWLIF